MLSNALGYPMHYNHPSEIMDEIAALTPKFAGVSFKKIEELGSVQWPCNDAAPEGTPVMHVDGFVRGKGKFVITDYVATDEKTGPRFPLLLLFGRQGPIGSWLAKTFGIVFAFRRTGAALACAIMGFPLLVRAIQLSVEAVDQRLEQAASTLGASRARVFVTVTLPLIAPGIVAGAILAFALSMGAFGATITFVSNIPDADPAEPDLYVHASARQRCRRTAAHADLGCNLIRCGIGGGSGGPFHWPPRTHRVSGQAEDPGPPLKDCWP